MGHCIRCDKTIADGSMLCDDCIEAEADEAGMGESYLDNLLNAVISPDKSEQKNEENDDTDNTHDSTVSFEQLKQDFNSAIDLSIQKYMDGEDESNDSDLYESDTYGLDDNEAYESDTYGMDNNEAYEGDTYGMDDNEDYKGDTYESDKNIDEDYINELLDNNLIEKDTKHDTKEAANSLDDIDDIFADVGDFDIFEDIDGIDPWEDTNTKKQDLEKVFEESYEKSSEGLNYDNEEINDDLYNMVDNILNDVDTEQEETILQDVPIQEEPMYIDDDLINQEENISDDAINEVDENIGMDDDLMKMLSGISEEGGDSEEQNQYESQSDDSDIMDLNSLLQDTNIISDNMEMDDLSGINDEHLDEDQDLLNLIPEKIIGKGKKDKKPKKSPKGKKENEDGTQDDGEGEENKKSIWKKIFGNVKSDKPKEIKPEVIEESEESEKKKLTKKEKKELKAKEKEEKKKGKKQGEESEGEEGDQRKRGSSDEESEEGEKPKKKKEKKEKKEKKVEQIVEEIDEGEINKIGATIVMVFFGLICAFIIFGTNFFTYNSNVNRATKHFENKKFVLAYEDIKGINIKESDQELYDKIQTLMFVQKEYESYLNFILMEKYSDGLDALVKGIGKYDKYIDKAKELGIKKDLDSILGDLIKALEDSYNITEEKARGLMKLDDKEDYTKEIIKIADNVYKK